MASLDPDTSTPSRLPPPPPAPNIPAGQNGAPSADPNSEFPPDIEMNGGPAETMQFVHEQPHDRQWGDLEDEEEDDDLYDGPPPQGAHPPGPLAIGPIRLPSNKGPLCSSLIVTSLATISSFFLQHFTSEPFDNPAAFYETLGPIQASIENLVTTWNRATGDALASPRSQSAHARHAPTARAPASPPPRSQPITRASSRAATARPAPEPRSGSARSFAQAAASFQPRAAKGKGGPAAAGISLQTVRGLAAAFPSASVHEITDMASRLATPASPQHKKPTVRHAPKGANKAITVSFTGSLLPNAAIIPADGQLLRELTSFLSLSLPDIFAGDPPSIRIERVQWLPNIGFRVTFSDRPPDSLDGLLHTYLARYTDSNSMHLRVSRFQFRSTVFFRRVPLCSPNGTPATVDSLLNELVADPLWQNITMAGRPRLHVPEQAQGYGILYVDFVDNARSSVLRNVLKQPVYLGHDLCRPLQATNSRPATPRCHLCQKWGHRAFSCRSPSVRCGHCGDTHDERQHVRLADCCRESPPTNGICDHPATCVNCHQNHRSDSKACSFFVHRSDTAWIRAHQPNPSPRPGPRSRANPNPSAVRSRASQPSQTPGASSSRVRLN